MHRPAESWLVTIPTNNRGDSVMTKKNEDCIVHALDLFPPSPRTRRLPLLVGVVLAGIVLSVSAACQAGSGCVTADCHSAFADTTPTHPANLDCTACHLHIADNHAVAGGAQSALQEDMCASCHEELLQHRVMHEPVSRTSCQHCHDPHGDMASKLLPSSYSTEPFVNYDDNAHSLCFTCHKRDLLMFPDTSYSTGFRHGIRNLHYLHVNKANRGRSCKLCHDVHGTAGEKLVADTVFFGNWRMPVAFRKTENGGSCAPGCHQPRQYDRTATGVVVPRQQESAAPGR